MRRFSDLTEQQILALAISNEEEDSRIYRGFSEGLRERFPDSAKVFDEMAARHRQPGGANDARTAYLWDELAGARRQLARLVVRGPGAFRSSEYAAALDRARAENDRAHSERTESYQCQIARKDYADCAVGETSQRSRRE